MKDTGWRILRKPSVISVFVLVAFWNVSISSSFLNRAIEGKGAVLETVQEIRDVNLHVQLRFYQLLTKLRPIPFQPSNVSLAYIDDDTHWTTLYGNEPTDRAYLARLITNASQTKTKARAIGLDIELLAPRHFPDGTDAAPRYAENQALLKAIQFAANQGVPVILASVYSAGEKRGLLELANIYTTQDLRSAVDCAQVECPVFGYINLPNDKREIPLTEQVHRVDGDVPQPFPSFALAIVEAIRSPEFVTENPLLAKSVSQKTRVDGTFLPERNYPLISVSDLFNEEPSAERACAGQIILIGGRWHSVQGHGDFIDQHLSPAGYLSGLGLHANYIESLLQHQFTRELPSSAGILIDLVIGFAIYVCFEIARRWWWKLLVLCSVLVLPVLFALLFLDITNRYLDFLLPIELYFLHILYELLTKHFRWKTLGPSQTKPRETAKASQVAVNPEEVTAR
jgi:CHASE2 domain-containing sensor protein